MDKTLNTNPIAIKTTPPAVDAKGDAVYDVNKVTNPTGPSSSSTVGMNNSIAQNTTTGTNTANGVKTPLSGIQSNIMNTYGFDESFVRGLDSTTQANFALQLRSEDIAQKQADQAKADERAIYQQNLAQQNAQYAQAKAELDTQKQSDLDRAKTTAANLNPYSGGNTDEDGYTGAINTQYAKLSNDLESKAAMANAALAAGDMKTYAAINDSLAKTKQEGLANIQNFLSDLKKTQIQQDQFDQTENDKKATLKQNDELKNTTLYQQALQNLPQPKDLAALGDDFSKLTPEQQSAIKGQQAYEVGIQAGLTPQAVWSGIKNAASAAYKQQAADAKQQQIAIQQQNANIAAQRAQVYMMTAQANLANKQAGAVDAQTVAIPLNGAFLSAFQNAQSAGKYTKDKNSTTLSTLAYNIGNGNIDNAKTAIVNYALSGGSATDQRMYQTLQGLPALVDSVKTKINALPKAQQQSFLTGSINEIASKFGQNPNPQLQEIALELGHLQKNYVAPIYGMRAASSNSDSIFNNLFPGGTDSNSLSLSKLNALVGTAQDTVNSQVQARIGSQPYQSIFGPAGPLGTGTSGANTWQGLQVGTSMINKNDGKVYTITANGPVLKQ